MAVIGRLVSFLASAPRISCLECWGADSPLAVDLARIGHAAWSRPHLLEVIEPVGGSLRTTVQLHGKVGDLYLASMAYPRIATQPARPEAVSFVERLRVLALLRALEATIAGIPRESHLEATCIALRHATEREFSPHWNWIHRVSHPENTGLDDFVAATLYRCEEAIDPETRVPLEESARQAVRHLVAVLSRERSAPPEKVARQKQKPAGAVPSPLSDSGQKAKETPRHDPFTTAVSNSIVSATDDAEEVQSFVVSDADSKRPPRAQRAKGTGLILQSIEDSQFLRHSWHRLGKHEVSAFFERLTELRDSAERQDQLGTALVGIAAATCVPLSGMWRIRIQSELTDDWTVDLQQGCLRRRPPRPSRR